MAAVLSRFGWFSSHTEEPHCPRTRSATWFNVGQRQRQRQRDWDWVSAAETDPQEESSSNMTPLPDWLSTVATEPTWIR
ncbi:hypothetical protein FQN60_011663 [Etheostoma spectabile]|uniref:Uncharacterized protein n=1 Tax=Etheostoma spectabile TaxID=54343 RepID=A0A5J5DMY0_9PERO|nr:hypothetical protein FQN60_011663 [Etheostoma spectabile]